MIVRGWMDRPFIVEAIILAAYLAFSWQALGKERLTLADSITIALEKHSTIQGARSSLTAAKARLNSSKTGFLPYASFSGNYTRLEDDRFQEMSLDLGTSVQSMSVPVMRRDQYTLNLQVSQPLFMGGAVYYSYKQAEGGADIAKDQLEKAQQDVALGVARAYYAVLRSQQLLRVANKTQEAMQAHCRMAKDFYEAGVVAKVDLLQAEVRLAEAQQAVIKSENGVETAKSAFNNAIGRDISDPVDLAEAHFQLPFEMTLSECWQTALEERPELVAIRKSQRVSRFSEKLTRSAFFPQLVGVYEHGLAKQTLSWDRDEDWSISLVASWDLWQWGKRKFDLDWARAKTAEVHYQGRLMEDGALLEVKQSYLAVEEAEKLISVTQRAIEQAEENVRMSNERYAQNVATITEVLDAEVLLANARLNYYVALYDCDVAVARLLHSMGRRMDERVLASQEIRHTENQPSPQQANEEQL